MSRDMRKTLKSTIAQDAFWSVNKKIALHTSLEAAVILAELVDKESFFENSLIFYEGDYYFYATAENIKEQTTIGYKPQKKAIELLKKADFIKTRLMSTPAKIHFAIMTENVLNFLANEESNNLQDLVCLCQNCHSKFHDKIEDRYAN